MIDDDTPDPEDLSDDGGTESSNADAPITDRELNVKIDRWLAQVRPDRYVAGDNEWLKPVVTKATAEFHRLQTIEEIVSAAVLTRVRGREGQATRKTNKILRDISETGALPLGWGDGENWKIMLIGTLSLPMSISDNRVRFGAATADDLTHWELERGREMDAVMVASAAARRGARTIADWLQAQGARRVEDLH